MKVTVGLRVVRGPDWEWEEQDGGEGGVGTVVNVTMEDDQTSTSGAGGGVATVGVQWDCGGYFIYRCGMDNKFDLRVIDTAQIGTVHRNPDSTHYFICNSCSENGFSNAIVGMRWKCFECKAYDLCTVCYNRGSHLREHRFFRIEEYGGRRILMPPRGNSRRLTANGLFRHAEVERGRDWNWGDDDGGAGNSGDLVSVTQYYEIAYRCVGEVHWKVTRRHGHYHTGLNGKVDLLCTRPASGGYYYPDHLPVLGKTLSEQYQLSDQFQPGDAVYVNTVDLAVFKSMQKGHGGWVDTMSEVIRQVGTVQSVLESGDVQVHFPRTGDYVYTINPKVLFGIGFEGDRGGGQTFQNQHLNILLSPARQGGVTGIEKTPLRVISPVPSVLPQYSQGIANNYQSLQRGREQTDFFQQYNTQLTPTRHAGGVTTIGSPAHHPVHTQHSGGDGSGYSQSLQRGARQASPQHYNTLPTPSRPAIGDMLNRTETPTSEWTPVARLDDKPKLPQLIGFNSKEKGVIDITARISTKYFNLGILLLDDETGSIMESLETRHQLDASRISLNIFKKWIQGQGVQPVTWKKLISVLCSVQLFSLAEDIKKSLSS